MSPALSVVVPLYNEEECVRPLIEAVQNALGSSLEWELLLIDDGSRDATAHFAQDAAAEDARIRLIPLARNYGQSLAIQAGFDHARGSVVVTMDGDLQNDPADIALLLAKLREGYDVVVGYRVGRQDSLLMRKLPSWIANAIIRRITGLPVRDIGCTLKAYRREVVGRIQLYADQHRFTPVLAASSFAARVSEVPVRHHPRRFGSSKYGLARVPKVVADMLIAKMILSYHDRPLALFGVGSLIALTISILFAVTALASVIVPHSAHAYAVVFPGVALLFLALASHLVLLGVLAEVLLRQWAQSGNSDLALRQVAA